MLLVQQKHLAHLFSTRAAALRRVWNELPGPPFVAERVGRGKGTILVT